jgi:predicted O-linked N-acetylglucosamine transferase (SPINDLY family)
MKEAADVASEIYEQALAAFRSGNTALALAVCERVLSADRSDADILVLAATILEQAGEKRKAAGLYAEAAALPTSRRKDIAFRAASLFEGLGERGHAFRVLAAAEPFMPDDADVLQSLCGLAREMGDYGLARDAALKLVSLSADFDASLSAGIILNGLGFFEEAYAALSRAHAERPDDRLALSECFWAAANVCDLDTSAALQARLEAAYRAEGDAPDIRENAFRALMWTGDEVLLARYARRTADVLLPPVAPAIGFDTNVEGKEPDIIRVGYVSCDFYDHATMSLLAGVLEAHDRDRFEIFAFCHSPPSRRGDAMHERMLDTVDYYVDILQLSDAEAAETIRSLGIDVLVDLKGFTQGSRLGIFCRRAAPIQVTWLGYPGSVTGAGIQYAITDHIVTPDASIPYFQEKLLRLPGSYQCNDASRERVRRTGSRAAHGLPEDAFVFAAFNHAAKIRLPVFDSWMRILSAVENAVLWLYPMGPLAQDNLRAAAAARGVAPERLIFARLAAPADHLRRLPQADLALDTGPCNGHTTTSDALWAGVPVVSFKGAGFAGRVSESLLNAVGLRELVADDLAGFEAMAIDIARDPLILTDLRERLIAARDTAPLFDTEELTRQVEAFYQTIVTASRLGE